MWCNSFALLHDYPLFLSSSKRVWTSSSQESSITLINHFILQSDSIGQMRRISSADRIGKHRVIFNRTKQCLETAVTSQAFVFLDDFIFSTFYAIIRTCDWDDYVVTGYAIYFLVQIA
jgi:hypothetical protein